MNEFSRARHYFASDGFPGWLYENGISVIVTTYERGKILVISATDDRRLSVSEQSVDRCMGMTVDTDTGSIYAAGRSFISKFRPYKTADGLVLDRELRRIETGELDTHDMICGSEGLIFVNTAYNCLATPEGPNGFELVWMPDFTDGWGPRDCCHLNGLCADEDGRPKFATAVAVTDKKDGWREERSSGGVVIDISTKEIVAEGLSMPHSPRLYQRKLWLHNSGSGEFGYIDLDTGRFEPVVFIPGYLRGMDFYNGFAVVGGSQKRSDKSFDGLTLAMRLDEEEKEAECGIFIIDIERACIAHRLRLEQFARELYDVRVYQNSMAEE